MSVPRNVGRAGTTLRDASRALSALTSRWHHETASDPDEIEIAFSLAARIVMAVKALRARPEGQPDGS